MKGSNILFVVIVFVLISCEGVFLEEDLTDEKITLVAPSDNSELESDDDFNFYWEDLDVESSYQIQIATPNFETPQEIIVDSTTTNYQLSLSLDAGTYQWRVRAKNDVYSSEYSPAFNFSIEESTNGNTDITNEVIVLISPSDNSELESSDNYDFYWEELEDVVTDYQIQIAKPDFDNPLEVIVDSMVSDHQVNLTLDAGGYQWRVRAKNDVYASEYSTFNIVIKESEE